MAHQYLYKVDPAGGQDYTSFSAARTQLISDWGTDKFDADVVIRLWNGTYDQDVHGAGLQNNATESFDLVIEAASGQTAVNLTTTGTPNSTYAWDFTQTAPNTIEYIRASGLNIAVNMRTYYVNMVRWENCTINTDYGFSSGSVAVFKNCSLVTGYYYGTIGSHLYMYNSTIRNTYSGASSGSFFATSTIIYDAVNSAFVSMAVNNTWNAVFPNAGIAKIDHCIFYQPVGVVNPMFTPNTAYYNTGMAIVTNSIFMNASNVFNCSNWVTLGKTGGSSFRIDGCCFYNCTKIMTRYGDTDITSIAELRAAGYDKTNTCISTDPKLVDVANGDFRIASDSPCRQTGLASAVRTDLSGNYSYAWQGRRPSIGVDARWDTDITSTVPTNPTAIDAMTARQVIVIWDNKSAYASGDLVYVVRDDTGAVLDRLDATADEAVVGSGKGSGYVTLPAYSITYTLKVKATSDNDNFSAYSATFPAITTPASAPDAPTDLTIVEGDSQLVFSFKGQTGKTYYARVYDRFGGMSSIDPAFSVIGAGVTPVSITITGLNNFRPYRGFVMGIDSGYCSTWVTDGSVHVPVPASTAHNYYSVGTIIRTKFKADIATPYSLPTQYDNENTGGNPGNSKWARLSVIDGAQNETTFGIQKRFRKNGLMIVDLFTPINNGDKDLRQLEDTITNNFRATSEGGITYLSPLVTVRQREDKWWRVSLQVPFYVDDFVL